MKDAQKSWNNGQSPQDRFLWAKLGVLQLYAVYLRDKDMEILIKTDWNRADEKWRMPI